MPNWFFFSFNSFFYGSLRRPRWSNAQRKKLDKATSRPRSHWRCPLIYELNKMTTCPLAFRKHTASLVHEFRIWFRNCGRTPHIVLFIEKCVQLRIEDKRKSGCSKELMTWRARSDWKSISKVCRRKVSVNFAPMSEMRYTRYLPRCVNRLSIGTTYYHKHKKVQGIHYHFCWQ